MPAVAAVRRRIQGAHEPPIELPRDQKSRASACTILTMGRYPYGERSAPIVASRHFGPARWGRLPGVPAGRGEGSWPHACRRIPEAPCRGITGTDTGTAGRPALACRVPIVRPEARTLRWDAGRPRDRGHACGNRSPPSAWGRSCDLSETSLSNVPTLPSERGVSLALD